MKEYDCYGKLLFEGEYLNGKKWNGKGKEHIDNNKQFSFEGKYLNGKKNGIIKIKMFSRDLLFRDEEIYIKREKWNGEIEEYVNNTLIIH